MITHQELIEDIVTLDVLSDLGQLDRKLLPRDIKLLWNLSKRFRYEESLIPFTDEEEKYFMSVSDYKGMPVPHFLVDFIELMAPRYLEVAHENSSYPEVDFEYYLINYIGYATKMLFPQATFMSETWRWLLEKVDFIIDGKTVSLPKLAFAYYYGSKEVQDQYFLKTIQGFFVFIMHFCFFYTPRFIGYQHPAWMKVFFDTPSSNILNSEKIGITLFLEAYWHFDPTLQQWLNINSKKDQVELVQWFIQHKSKEIPGYQHPQWVVDLFGEQINVREENTPTAEIDTESSREIITENHDHDETQFARGGVNLIGWPRTAVGIGEDVRVAASALLEINLPFVVLDGAKRVPPRVTQQDLGIEKCIVESPQYNTDIVFLDAATQFRYFCFDLLKNKKTNRNIIIACPWELPSWPADMDFVFQSADMFWAATRYIYDAFKPYFPEGKIFLAPSAVHIPEGKIEPFSLLKINEPFTFLTTFDGESSIHRKNPFAVVNAFQAAFPKSNRDVRLIVKTMNLKNTNTELNSLIEKIKADDRIELINQTLSTDELLALNKRSHCFVSLHRSEGFGRNIAENMLLGRPVICSAFSGNLDFCFENNSYLVEGKTIPVKAGQYAFSRNQYWFDASVEHAAVRMREVYENRENAEKVAKAGGDYIKSFHSVTEAGKRYQKLLNGII